MEDAIHRADIDPLLKMFLDAMPMTFNADDGVEVARDALAALKVPAELLPNLRTEDRIVGYGELTDIPIRIYWPPLEGQDGLPVVVYYHGGGWSLGSVETHDPVARMHAVGAEAIVVSVDYRLAPENPWPAGIEDSWAALRWVAEHAAEFGGDPNRIAVAGDSAGGNIAAIMAQLARDSAANADVTDAAVPALVFQLLWYPSCIGDLTLPSFVEHANAYILDLEVIHAFLQWYVPGLELNDYTTLPANLVPGNGDLVGLAPAFIGTAEHDPLRDDGARYAQLLNAAGVRAELVNEPNMVHGYVNFAAVLPAATEATSRGLTALKKALYP